MIKKASKDLFGIDIEPELARPEEQFGDFSTNVALQLAPQLSRKPHEIADQLVEKLQSPLVTKTEVASPGFINFWLSSQALVGLLDKQPEKKLAGQEVVVEYSDPNPFKVLHVGHLYTSVVGDAIAKLFEAAGANVHRVNFGGDVGLHVAKTMWAILKNLGGAYPGKLKKISPAERAGFMADAYIEGTLAYDKSNQGGEDPQIKIDVLTLNKIIYDYYSENRPLLVLELPCSLGTDPQALLSEKIIDIYKVCRVWSYDYFDDFYARIGSHFEKYYTESEAVKPGLKAVEENIGKVFEKSDGAIVFKGEVHNMHTRVFINSQGLPTYETKDVGLIMLKNDDYHFDRSIIVTANEQFEYMQVVLKAVEQIMPDLAKKTTHITHGLVKLAGGVKMSSRMGNIIKAEDVLEAAAAANKQINRQENKDTALGAVKYAFLKHRIGADIIFDPAESVSLQGNSGPYLQYAYVRAKSILQKAGAKSVDIDKFEAGERSLARKISEYPEVVENAVEELMPHHVATYLYELAQTFNRFYENNRVIGDSRQGLRLQLVQAYANVLKAGLELLNIPVLEKM